MKLKYFKAKNFLSIGEEPIEIDFTKLGNIVNIRGQNLDSGVGASNGAGKSTLIEAIVYGLYGKLIKGLNHKEAVNIKSKRGLSVEVHWDDYKVIREREPNKTTLWKGDEDISLSGIPATDNLIKNIIGLDHNAFINVACFGQHNIRPFLCCTAEEKRRIAEQLLSLDKYLKYHEVAKKKLKVIRDKISQISLMYQSSLSEATSARKKQVVLAGQDKNWREAKSQEISALEVKITQIRNKLAQIKDSDDVREYDKAQKELATLETEIEKREKIRTDLHALLEKAETAIRQKREEKQTLEIDISRYDRELVMVSGDIATYQEACDLARSKNGATCPECYGEITEKNIAVCLERNIEKIKKCQIKWTEANKNKAELTYKLETLNAALAKVMDARAVARDRETLNLGELGGFLSRRKELMKIRKPDRASEAMLLEKDLHHAVGRLEESKKELANGSPFLQMLSIAEDETVAAESQCKVYKGDLKLVEEDIPYFEFWTKAFSDEGIRAFVINEIIPALNARINYWLQFLMDGRINVKFDNELDERITRIPMDDNQFVYNSLSGGEHSRIDLAISQAFAHVMMMTSGACPSIVALDEVGANIDRPGIQAVYKMICELSRDRQVLVITHDTDLMEMLSGYDTIEVVMKNGITTLKK